MITYVASMVQSLLVIDVMIAVRVASGVVVPAARAVQVYLFSTSPLPSLSTKFAEAARRLPAEVSCRDEGQREMG